MHTIKKLSEFQFNKLNLHDFDNSLLGNRYIACELSYSENIDPVLLSIDYLNVLNYVNGDIYVELNKENETYKFLEEFDNAIIRLLKDTKIMKKLKIVNPILKTLIVENEHDNKKHDCLRLKIAADNYFATKIYDHNKNEFSRSDFELSLTKGNSLKSILEILSILFDTRTNTINLVSVLRQGCVKKNKPIRLPLNECCFENSSDEYSSESKTEKLSGYIEQSSLPVRHIEHISSPPTSGKTLLDMLKESTSSASSIDKKEIINNISKNKSESSDSEESNSFEEFVKSDSISSEMEQSIVISSSEFDKPPIKKPVIAPQVKLKRVPNVKPKKQPLKKTPVKRKGKK
jgi:hypothetical protein